MASSPRFLALIALVAVLLAARSADAQKARAPLKIVIGAGLSPWSNVLSMKRPPQVFVGDTLVFKWANKVKGAVDDVVQVYSKASFSKCLMSGQARRLAGPSAAGSYEYKVTYLDQGTWLYFFCGSGQHCVKGQKIKFFIN